MSTWNPMSQSYDRPSLAEFLLARIAEDEALATVPEPKTAQHMVHLADAVGTWDARCPTCVQMGSAGRLLAECEAKRRIVEMYVKHITPDEDGFADHREDDGFGWFDEDRKYHHGKIGMEYNDGHFVALRDACLALAQPYADHADFDPRWAVTATV